MSARHIPSALLLPTLALACPTNVSNPDPPTAPPTTPPPPIATAPHPPLAPTPQPTPAPAPAEPPPPTTLAALATDTAIILRDFDILTNDAQCSNAPDWATLPGREVHDQTALRTGDLLHVITDASVERWTIEADDSSASATPTPAPKPGTSRFALATKNFAPSPSARLEPRRLAKPGKDARKLADWLRKQVKFEVRAVGQLEGTFGDGVDRIMLFEPRDWIDPAADPEEPPRRSELAVLVAADVPKGWLPFGILAEEPDAGWDDGAYGLQVLGVVDIDGDDVQEILWLSQSINGDPLWTGFELSYLDGANGFATQQLGGCSYNGCDAFLPRAECRGVMKPKMR